MVIRGDRVLGFKLLHKGNHMNKKITIEISDELIEALADLEHDRWSGWEKYREQALAKEPARLERWRRLREAPYQKLTEQEKESDRVEVRKTLDLLEKLALTQDDMPLSLKGRE